MRIITKDADGRLVARYDEGAAEDHYAHAANYAELARTGWRRRLSTQGFPVVVTVPGGGASPAANDPFAVPRANAAATRGRQPARPPVDPGAGPARRAKARPPSQEEADVAADLAAVARGEGQPPEW